MYDRLRENIRHLHPLLDDWMIDEGYGKVLSRPGLDLPRRELCIVAACAATGQDRQLHSHLHGARTSARRPTRSTRPSMRSRDVLGAARLRDRANFSGRGCAGNEQRVHRSRRREREGGRAAARASSRSAARSSSPWAVPTAATADAAATSSSSATPTSRRCSTTRIAIRGGHRRRPRLRDRTRRAARATTSSCPFRSAPSFATSTPRSDSAKCSRTATRLIVAQGGRGGKGNAFFTTSTHQSPREYQPGEDGETRTLELELKLIADVGLVGQPNAGKSTLAVGDLGGASEDRRLPVHHARPESRRRAAERTDRTFVVADIPGIIEGAHEGTRARASVPPPHRADARSSRS